MVQWPHVTCLGFRAYPYCVVTVLRSCLICISFEAAFFSLRKEPYKIAVYVFAVEDAGE